jgi:outer membrane lipoprotein SlyB
VKLAILKNSFLTILLLLSLGACSSKPVLYPNTKLKKVGKEKGKEDSEKCLAEADEYLDSPQGKKILKSAGKGSLIGGALGTVAGLFTGDIGGSLVQGAALGATAGGVGAAISPDELKQRYVNKCLNDQGYKVLGWD